MMMNVNSTHKYAHQKTVPDWGEQISLGSWWDHLAWTQVKGLYVCNLRPLETLRVEIPIKTEFVFVHLAATRVGGIQSPLPNELLLPLAKEIETHPTAQIQRIIHRPEPGTYLDLANKKRSDLSSIVRQFGRFHCKGNPRSQPKQWRVLSEKIHCHQWDKVSLSLYSVHWK